MGEIVGNVWLNITDHFHNISLDEFVIMPDHFHGIIIINECVSPIINEGVVGAIHESPLQNTHRQMTQYERRIMTLPKIIGKFKMVTAKEINLLRKTQGTPVWQRNYYEHIIRGDRDFQNIREYIRNNPLKWHEEDDVK